LLPHLARSPARVICNMRFQLCRSLAWRFPRRPRAATPVDFAIIFLQWHPVGEIFIIYGLWLHQYFRSAGCMSTRCTIRNGGYASEFCGPLIYLPFACGLCAFFGRQLLKIAFSSALGNKFFSVCWLKKLNDPVPINKAFATFFNSRI